MGKRGPNASKEKPWADALRVALKRPAEGDPENRKNLAVIAEKCVEAAKAGDMAAIREIGDRMDGKPVADVNNTITGDITHRHEQVANDADAFEGRIAGLAAREGTHSGTGQTQ